MKRHVNKYSDILKGMHDAELALQERKEKQRLADEAQAAKRRAIREKKKVRTPDTVYLVNC